MNLQKKFIFFSTVKSASDKVEGKCLTEECVPTPVGPYGESKIKAEDYIIRHFALKLSNVLITILMIAIPL